MTITSNIQDLDLTVSSNHGEVKLLKVDTQELATLHVGSLPSVTVSDPGLAARVAETEGGLIQFNNTVHVELSPFSFSNGVEFDIPIRNDGGIFSEAPAGFQNLIDNTDNSIAPINVFDVWDMKLVCKIKTDLADRTGLFSLFIGGSIGAFNDFEIKGSPSADTVIKRTIDKWFYTGSTFAANGGFLRGSFDGDGEMYDIVIVFNRKKSGADL